MLNLPLSYQPQLPTPEMLEPGEIEHPYTLRGEQLYISPGADWMVNIDNNDTLHEVTILMEHEGVKIAPFIRYDFDTNSPELLTTHG